MAIKDIIVRPVQDDDYLEICDWLKDRKWTIPPAKGSLPATGYIAEENGKPIAAAFLYLTNSSIGIFDWLSTNPESGYKGLVGLKKISEHIKKVSDPDVSVILSFQGNGKLANYMTKKLGYKRVEKVDTLAWVR
jgi:hypothetical protein